MTDENSMFFPVIIAGRTSFADRESRAKEFDVHVRHAAVLHVPEGSTLARNLPRARGLSCPPSSHGPDQVARRT